MSGSTPSRRLLSPRQAFLASTVVSALGDGFRYAALPLVLTLNGAGPGTLGALLAAATLPALTVGLLGGALADRVDRVRLLRNADLTRCAALVAFVAAMAADVSAEALTTLAFLVAFVMGVAESVALPATFGLTPALVPDRDLPRFNGRLVAGQTLGRGLLGPALGAVLVERVSTGPFLIDALTFGLSWLLLGRLRGAVPAMVRPETALLSDVAAGLRWMRKQPMLLGLAAVSGLLNLGYMAFVAVSALYVTRELSASPSAFGLLLTIEAIGGTAAAVAFERLSAGGRPGGLAAAGGLVAAAMTMLALAPNLPVAFTGALLLGAGFAL